MSPQSSMTPFKVEKQHRLLIILHWITLIFVIGILGVGAYRSWGLRTTAATSSRMDIVVITAAGKSLIFLIYILVTSHITRLSHKYSPKAVLVLSCVDTVFWLAALALTAYSVVSVTPTGTRAVLSYILIVLLVIVFLISLPVLYLAFGQYRYMRQARRRGDDVELVRDGYLAKA